MLDISAYDVFLFDLMGTMVHAYEEGEVMPTPGLIEFLNLLQEEEKKMGVVTSASREKAEVYLKLLDLDSYFDVVITADDVEETKPAPEPYLKALAQFNTTPDTAIAFEDTPGGILSAKEAGIFTVLVAGEYPNPEATEIADMVIPDFTVLVKGLVSGQSSQDPYSF